MIINSLDTTNPETREREAYLNEIGRIIRMDFGVEKLRAIAVLWMKHPQNGYENRQQMAACAAYCKDLRETRANQFGSSLDPNSSFRSSFSPPAGLLDCIESFFIDGMFTGKEGKKNWLVFKVAFPEFMASDRY